MYTMEWNGDGDGDGDGDEDEDEGEWRVKSASFWLSSWTLRRGCVEAASRCLSFFGHFFSRQIETNSRKTEFFGFCFVFVFVFVFCSKGCSSHTETIAFDTLRSPCRLCSPHVNLIHSHTNIHPHPHPHPHPNAGFETARDHVELPSSPTVRRSWSESQRFLGSSATRCVCYRLPLEQLSAAATRIPYGRIPRSVRVRKRLLCARA